MNAEEWIYVCSLVNRRTPLLSPLPPPQPSSRHTAAAAATSRPEARTPTAVVVAAAWTSRVPLSLATETPSAAAPPGGLRGGSGRGCCWTTTSTWPSTSTPRRHREAPPPPTVLSSAPTAAPRPPERYERTEVGETRRRPPTVDPLTAQVPPLSIRVAGGRRRRSRPRPGSTLSWGGSSGTSSERSTGPMWSPKKSR